MSVLVDHTVEFQTIKSTQYPVSVRVSCFRGAGGVVEYHIVARPIECGSIEQQLEWVWRAYRNALDWLQTDTRSAVLRRFFCSDLSNQVDALEGRAFSNPRNTGEPCAISWVRQPPLPPGKVAMWAYHVCDPAGPLNKQISGGSLVVRRGGLSHHWTTGVTCLDSEMPYGQTRGIFEKYGKYLQSGNMTLADNALRTWLFVQNIDANYMGMVEARREYFAEHGLTPATHFVASTGIEGAHTNVAAKVAMDAYAVSGVRPEQIKYLAALDHLSPTHVYGVTFERGTSVEYRDRRHAIISGTASIDREGNIVHAGDVSSQLGRTLENIDALLKPAGASLKDMAVYIVYVRDPSDHEIAWRQMRERCGEAPFVVVAAPVCRPGWLIEVEGIAIVSTTNPGLPAF